MKPQHIVATCLRFLAVIWLLFALSRVHGVLAYARTDPSIAISHWMVWITVLVQLAACAALWFFPMTIASKLIPGGVPAEVSSTPPQLAEWQTLGVIVIGLWGLAHAIPDLVFWFTFAALSFRDVELSAGLTPHQKASVASSVVELALSLWLILGAKGFAALLFRIRTAGIAK